MAEIKTILDCEACRTDPATWRRLHLHKEGLFYRAYNWSAWLMSNHLQRSIKINKKVLKATGQEFVYVGFPVSSLERFTPQGATMLQIFTVEVSYK